MKILRVFIIGFLPIFALIALPIVFRPQQRPARDFPDAERIVIITPHTESIRYEFEEAFKAHYFETTGRRITFDWRMPGGTADITRYVDDRFAGEFRRYWESRPDLGGWSRAIADNFSNSRLDSPPDEVDPLAVKARAIFMASDVGIGIDLFFGGGQYEMEKQAQKGYGVDAGLLRSRPEWFTDDVIPHRFSGETFYDAGGRYYGACIATFGICYNSDYIEQLGIPVPKRWRDIGGEKFFGTLAVADPTKSGSINKCFEMIIQQMMGDSINSAGAKTPAALEQGWSDGLNLIKRIGANSRSITDSASKVPKDVAQGDAAAGISIDFYGRTEAEWARAQSEGESRIVYIAPIGGSSVSADPIMLFRGAPNRDAATAFIEFVLSKQGQRIWNARPGTPGGPKKYALRRLSVRKDMYGADERKFMSDPEAAPFAPEQEFNYDPSLTARYFSLIRVMIKAMVIDPLPELQKAWRAIIEAGGPDACPDAVREFDKLPFAYAEADMAAASLNPSADGNTPLLVLKRQREMTDFFRTQYLIAARLAESGM